MNKYLKITLAVLTFALLAVCAWAQTPVVPSQSNVAGFDYANAYNQYVLADAAVNGAPKYIAVPVPLILSATNPPVLKGLGASGEIVGYVFEAATGEGDADNAATPTNEQCYASLTLPGGFVEGSVVYPRIGWAQTRTNGYTTGSPSNVVWSLEYAWVGLNGAMVAPAVQHVTNATSGVNWQKQYSTWSVTNTSGKVFDQLLMRIWRGQTNTASSRYTNDVAAYGVDVVLPVNKLGATTTTTK